MNKKLKMTLFGILLVLAAITIIGYSILSSSSGFWGMYLGMYLLIAGLGFLGFNVGMYS